MDVYSIKFLEALLLTVFVETIALWLLQRKRSSLKRIIGTGVLCSSATLPYVWFILPEFFPSFILFTIIAELSVFVIEAVMIQALLNKTWKRAFLLSLICNAASFLIGLIIF